MAIADVQRTSALGLLVGFVCAVFSTVQSCVFLNWKAHAEL